MKAWKVIGRCLLVLLCVVLVIAIVGIAQFFHRSDPKNVKRYDTDNPFITGETAISAHRSGAGDYPEETLAAFRGCVEDPDFAVDYFEFDLHMTADDVLVLSHDSTLDRVSDAVTVFGAENVLVRDKTLAELKDLNIETIDIVAIRGRNAVYGFTRRRRAGRAAHFVFGRGAGLSDLCRGLSVHY